VRWGERIAAANRAALAKILEVRPMWTDVAEVRFVAPELGERDILHAGPPIDWDRMAEREQRAVVDAILLEEWADTPEAAAALVERQAVRLLSNHDLGGVAASPGIVSPRAPVFVVEDPRTGARAYGARVEALFSAPMDEEGQARRSIWRTVIAPTLARAVQTAGGIDLTPILREAIARGDDLHARASAATSLVALEIVSCLLKAGVPRSDLEAVVTHLRAHESFFLPLAMAASKLMADAATPTPDSTLVTAVSCNGAEVGVRIAGLEGRWFSAPAPGRGASDAGILEAMGLGSSVLCAAPAAFERVGVKAAGAASRVRAMREICAGTHPDRALPGLDLAEAPLGIDLRRVVETGIVPFIDGTTEAPRACFVKALDAFAEARGVS
jgi:hypothetical protein